MSPAFTNFLFEAVNFLLLAGALGWFLFNPIRRALDAERERHVKEETEIAQLRAEAEAAARATHAAREAAGRELDERRHALLAAAQIEASQLVEIARQGQLAERRALDQELKIRRNAEAVALAETVGRVAAESVRRLLDALDGPSLDLALVRLACAELQALSSDARRTAIVETARPLEADARQLLEGVLGDRFKERIVGELAAGVRVTTTAGEIDSTAVSLARRAARAVSALGAEPADNAEGGDD